MKIRQLINILFCGYDDWRLEIGDCRSKNAAETYTRPGHRVPQRVITFGNFIVFALTKQLTFSVGLSQGTRLGYFWLNNLLFENYVTSALLRSITYLIYHSNPTKDVQPTTQNHHCVENQLGASRFLQHNFWNIFKTGYHALST